MCEKVFSVKEINEENYNFILSNLILCKKDEFTYEDILRDVKSILKEITIEIEKAIKRCIVRLRENGYLSELGSTYIVE